MTNRFSREQINRQDEADQSTGDRSQVCECIALNVLSLVATEGLGPALSAGFIFFPTQYALCDIGHGAQAGMITRGQR